jgi:5-methylcytosine-specific restriction endonuclease McrA
MAQLTARQAEYRQYLRSFRWQLVRRLRLWLDDGRCRVCNERGRLEVHHRSYDHRGGSLEGELRDTIALCGECHDWAHRKGLSQ